ncbi:cell division protein FtsQ/DivIB [Saccharomonospora piscinae]|uniref:cell division protein FtsQ/DivIB n=1 Tax=Saccharomonospora piscinae TaxID=687388 RepID=UPI001FDA4118|nr:FtsQ-type POTRA domain-containing protein [Saccharomonospora piscinae]
MTSPSSGPSCSSSWTAGTGEDGPAVATTRAPKRERARPRPRGSASRRRRAPSRQQVVQRRRIAALSVLTVITLAYLVWFTPLLGVSTVEVTGARAVGEQRVRAAADVPLDHPMLRLDTDAIAARVAALPGVAGVDVSRSWPSTVTVTVTERRAVAYHDGGDGIRLVDSAGVLFQRVEAAPEGLPRLEVLDPGPADDETTAATGALASLPAELAEQVVAVAATTAGSVEFELTGDRTVRWGDAEQNGYKARVLGVLLGQDGTVFDVSSPELPTVS